MVREHSRGEPIGTVGGGQLVNPGSTWAAGWSSPAAPPDAPAAALIGRGLPRVHPGPGPDEGQVVLQQRVSSMVRPAGHRSSGIKITDSDPPPIKHRSAVVLEIYAREHAPPVGNAVTRLGA